MSLPYTDLNAIDLRLLSSKKIGETHIISPIRPRIRLPELRVRNILDTEHQSVVIDQIVSERREKSTSPARAFIRELAESPTNEAVFPLRSSSLKPFRVVRLNGDMDTKSSKKLGSLSFYDLMLSGELFTDQTLIRTLVKMLLRELSKLSPDEEMELDVRLEHLYISKTGKLKLYKNNCPNRIRLDCDCQKFGSISVFRPPECKEGVYSQEAMNIYATGVLLFVFKFHKFPYDIKSSSKTQKKLAELFLRGDPNFWKIFCDYHKINDEWDEESKQFVFWLTTKEYQRRPRLADVLTSKWVMGPVYPKSELLKRLNLKIKKKASDLGHMDDRKLLF